MLLVSKQLWRPGLTQRLIRTAVTRAGKQLNQTDPKPPLPKDQQRKVFAERLFPRFMRSYASKIASSPASHVTAFLAIHELSAVVPLFGIWGALWYLDWAPTGLPDWVAEQGTAFIGRMADRNGWTTVNAEEGSKLLVQGAVAWAAVKVLMPVRLLFSLWATPWTARWFVVPITSRVAAAFRRAKTKSS